MARPKSQRSRWREWDEGGLRLRWDYPSSSSVHSGRMPDGPRPDPAPESGSQPFLVVNTIPVHSAPQTEILAYETLRLIPESPRDSVVWKAIEGL